ncbi:unnamed protein product [Thelazia callipaeda]|uniref:Transmembrane protein 47 n=1 Tax=Thelazia callipaeda TaxID=103827 RepID=A0A0N5CRT6_THECL|nr:unnamed protein product [Thelazia callipaeda]
MFLLEHFTKLDANSSIFFFYNELFHSCFMAHSCQRSISPGKFSLIHFTLSSPLNVIEILESKWRSTQNVINFEVIISFLYKNVVMAFCLFSAYIRVVAALLIIAAVLTVFAFVLNVIGLRLQDLHCKYIFYKFATYLSLLGVFLELVSLIVFPVCFYVEMKNFGYRNWEFDWSYGVAWGATLFTFGASLLLICDKEHEEVYFKEKTIYNPPPELK